MNVEGKNNSSTPGTPSDGTRRHPPQKRNAWGSAKNLQPSVRDDRRNLNVPPVAINDCLLKAKTKSTLRQILETHNEAFDAGNVTTFFARYPNLNDPDTTPIPDHLVAALNRTVNDFQPPDLANSAIAFAQLRIPFPKALRNAFNNRPDFNDFNGQELADCLWAFGAAETPPPQALSNAWNTVYERHGPDAHHFPRPSADASAPLAMLCAQPTSAEPGTLGPCDLELLGRIEKRLLRDSLHRNPSEDRLLRAALNGVLDGNGEKVTPEKNNDTDVSAITASASSDQYPSSPGPPPLTDGKTDSTDALLKDIEYSVHMFLNPPRHG